ncbi:protein-glutamate methylesterase/protein-glutamine glutaminase [Zhaonella formicivorans]|uniref:protein-glutamate methylesterase/protein-glutamine glutaminase n=1 Tax=Zhaonella formicivorans TaxID=2528593 RepID=UPI0010E0B87A|nr:chemotaxis response regulator protein-glutamate methylesterase [Zhaonella formicivorans]
MKSKIRVLLADDSALMRKYIKEILEQDPQLEVVALARDGEEVVGYARETRPDVITMDINMPKMDGLTALQYIMNTTPCPVVILSSLAKKGELVTFEALELGAVDYIAKPDGTVSLEINKIADEIRRKVKAAAQANLRAAVRTLQKTEAKAAHSFSRGKNKLVVIGVSTGGPKTLSEILPMLPRDFPAPILVVQHMPSNFTASFASRLNSICRLQVAEAKDRQEINQGCILVAPGDLHLKVERKLNGKLMARITKEPSGTLFRPSVDVTMESALKVAGRDLVGVLLTGMGDDGANAMVKIKNSGGKTIVESSETAIVWGMPKEALNRGGAEVVAPSYKIAEEIIKAVTI